MVRTTGPCAARDTVVENNIWVDNGQWQVDFHGWVTAQNYWPNHLPTMTKGYESVAKEPAWKGMRGMEYHPRDAPLGEEGYEAEREERGLHQFVFLSKMGASVNFCM